MNIAHGGTDQIIDRDQKRQILTKILDQHGDYRKILAIPPDITRYPSNAGELTQILYDLWSEANGEIFDVLPAIGTHSPMTADQIAFMFGELENANYFEHDWRNDLFSFGAVPADFVREVSDGKVDYEIPVSINRRIVEGDYDLIISIGQVVPHEVVGMANGFKNVLVGTGGREMINKSHFLGAVDGIERLLGRTETSVRSVFNYAHENFISDLGIVYLMSVMSRDRDQKTVMRGLFAGRDRKAFEAAADLSREANFDLLDQPISRCVVYLDPLEFKSTWLGNKAIYRTRMAMADHGELIVIAPGVKEFGEDGEIDRLIRKFGYFGTETTLRQVAENRDLRDNLSAAAHLIHGTSEGRFRIIYAAGGLSRLEIESVGYEWANVDDLLDRYDVKNLSDGQHDDFFFVSNPAQGLWALKSQWISDL